MNATQKQAIFALFSAITESVKVAGDLGAPGGVLYAALMGKLTLDQFEKVMGALVQAGNLKKRGDCYFYVRG